MDNATGSSVISQLVSSYFELPVTIHWEKASGLPFPDRFEGARLEFGGPYEMPFEVPGRFERGK